ncbi:hypothetical protein E1B28_008862 [Marasmius oreades]|uniref:EKC/KEOPS complex subunit BUD32 n=1 Tax=Marasmius oreades TaxID=181124 RepID=A0A9P7S0H3_9AGAR|nr:uncharacterized protein E1B28_008862 [Marasmius oreades]KAG7092511.1 hypothetical protein E1B28_008862 [Marasmius oreades]
MSASQNLIDSALFISQGAEAASIFLLPVIFSPDNDIDSIGQKVYKAQLTSNSSPILLKHRFQKQYRHPTLDASLTRSRIAGEARTLLRCLRAGVNVPGIRMVDATNGVLGIQWIEGESVRKLLPGEAEGEDNEEVDLLQEYGISIDEIMNLVGTEIAKMHKADVIHGDLTTSNMMIRPIKSSQAELILIDFGLAFQSTLTEDKAVDLYVLERAFLSTHPDSEPMFASVLAAYEQRMGNDWAAIKSRLDDVRLRGRKRSMVG